MLDIMMRSFLSPCLTQAWQVHNPETSSLKVLCDCCAGTAGQAGAENGALTEEEEDEEERERLEEAVEVVGEMQLTAEQLKVLRRVPALCKAKA